MIIVTSSFPKSVLPLHKNAKPVISNSSGVKSGFAKLRFRDGLVWAIVQTVEMKLHFQNSPAKFIILFSNIVLMINAVQ